MVETYGNAKNIETKHFRQVDTLDNDFKLGFEEIEQTKTHIKMELNKEKYIAYANYTKCGVKKEKL